MFLDFLGKQAGSLLSCFSRHDYKCMEAAFKMYEQQKMMFEQNVRSCADRIISIYQPHLRPIVGTQSRLRKNRLGDPQKESSQHHRRPRGSFTLATSQLGQDKLADPR